MAVGAVDQAFWLKVMEEHAEFIYNHLSPREAGRARQAEGFMEAYSRLHRVAQQQAQAAVSPDFAREALAVSGQFHAYKVEIMRERLDNAIVFNLTPAFMNGILMELEEYMRLLAPVARGEAPPPEGVFHHLFLWLPDQIGHAGLLLKDLDFTEREMSRLAGQYQATFTELYLNAIQVAGYGRATPAEVPALQELVEQTAEQVKAFYAVVQRAVALYQSDRLLSRSTLTFLTHHFGESVYFLRKLAESMPAVAAARPELFVPPQ